MSPAGQSINLLSPGNGINIPSKTEYEKNKVLTIYNIIRQLKLLARIHCVIMPLTRLAHSVEYIFIEDAEERHADPTYPKDPEENKRLNMLVYTYLLTIMGPLWAGVHHVMDERDYERDDCEHHVRDRDNPDIIIERYPLVAVLLKKIKDHVNPGATILVKQLKAFIATFSSPSKATNPAIWALDKWFDDLEEMWRSIMTHEEVSNTEKEMCELFLDTLETAGSTDSLHLPTSTFIYERRKAIQSSPLKGGFIALIQQTRQMLTVALYSRQSTVAISNSATTEANAVITDPCPVHPGAPHTKKECRVLNPPNGAKGKGKSPQRSPQPWAKNSKPNTKRSRSPPSHKARKRTKGEEGGYKGKNFDPAKSAGYRAYLASIKPKKNNGGTAAGQAGQASSSTVDAHAVTFAFHTRLEDGSADDEDYKHESVPYGDSEVTYEADIDIALAKARTLAELVTKLELLAQGQVETLSNPSEYHARFHNLLQEINWNYIGMGPRDPRIHIQALEDQIHMLDQVFIENSASDILEASAYEDILEASPVTMKDVFGSDYDDGDDDRDKSPDASPGDESDYGSDSSDIIGSDPGPFEDMSWLASTPPDPPPEGGSYNSQEQV